VITALGARVHIIVRPAYRERLTQLFRDVLECEVRELDFGMQHPIVLVSFSDGSAFSVEFSSDAPDEDAFCRTWIEFRTPDVAGVQRRLRDAGVEGFSHPGSPHTYFKAPGGAVMRFLDVGYRGP
jgi:hypothetical protein